MEEDWPSLKGGVHIHDSYEWIDEKGENCNQWFMINPRLFLNVFWYYPAKPARARKVRVTDQMWSWWLTCSSGKWSSFLERRRVVFWGAVGISEQWIDLYQRIHFVREERLIFDRKARFFHLLRRTLVRREFCFWQSKFCNMSQQIDNDRYWMRLDMNYYLVHTTVMSLTSLFCSSVILSKLGQNRQNTNILHKLALLSRVLTVVSHSFILLQVYVYFDSVSPTSASLWFFLFAIDYKVNVRQALALLFSFSPTKCKKHVVASALLDSISL